MSAATAAPAAPATLPDVTYVRVKPRSGNLVARLLPRLDARLGRRDPEVRFGAEAVTFVWPDGRDRVVPYAEIERVLMPAVPMPHVSVWLRPKLEEISIGRWYAPAGSADVSYEFGVPNGWIVLGDGSRLPISPATCPILEEFKRRLPEKAGAPQLGRRYYEDVLQMPGAEAWGHKPPAPKASPGAKGAAVVEEEEEDPHAEMAGR